MGAETKKLAEIEFITDTDVSYYQIGDVQGAFQRSDLEKYIKNHGHERLCEHLSFLSYQVWDVLGDLRVKEANKNAKLNESNSSGKPQF